MEPAARPKSWVTVAHESLRPVGPTEIRPSASLTKEARASNAPEARREAGVSTPAQTHQIDAGFSPGGAFSLARATPKAVGPTAEPALSEVERWLHKITRPRRTIEIERTPSRTHAKHQCDSRRRTISYRRLESSPFVPRYHKINTTPPPPNPPGVYLASHHAKTKELQAARAPKQPLSRAKKRGFSGAFIGAFPTPPPCDPRWVAAVVDRGCT
jgi:hypothetical protein